jgi:hypothetical protein
MSEELTNEDMRDALDRVARSSDGVLLYRYLQKTLCAVTTDSMPEGALRRNEGRRSLAAELMGLMAEGIRSSGRADSPVTFALAGARAVARSRGAGRRVSADTIVSGWSTDADTSPGSGSTNGSGES